MAMQHAQYGGGHFWRTMRGGYPLRTTAETGEEKRERERLETEHDESCGEDHSHFWAEHGVNDYCATCGGFNREIHLQPKNTTADHVHRPYETCDECQGVGGGLTGLTVEDDASLPERGRRRFNNLDGWTGKDGVFHPYREETLDPMAVSPHYRHGFIDGFRTARELGL